MCFKLGGDSPALLSVLLNKDSSNALLMSPEESGQVMTQQQACKAWQLFFDHV